MNNRQQLIAEITSKYHCGQRSQTYHALSALGRVFSPNMSSLDEDSSEYFAYDALRVLATHSEHITKNLTRELLINELARIYDIASGHAYYDYDNQQWVDAIS